MIKFIKKLCYICSKRLIRFIIYFSIISTLLVSSCFANSNYYYDTFSDLVGDGTVYVTIGMDYSLNSSNQEVPNFNDIVIRDSESRRFNSFGIIVGSKDGRFPTISGQVSASDVLMLEHYVRIECEKGSAYYVTGEVTNNAYLQLITDNGNINISARSFYDDLTVTSTDDMDIITFHVKVNYKFSTSNYLRGISYYFLQAFDSGLVTCRFVPTALDDGYLFYLGNSQGAPVFSDFEEFGNSIDDAISVEDELISDFAFASAFGDFTSWISSFGSSLYYARAFNFITSILSLFFNNVTPLRLLISFSLFFGLYSVLLLGASYLTNYIRRHKDG